MVEREKTSHLVDSYIHGIVLTEQAVSTEEKEVERGAIAAELAMIPLWSCSRVQIFPIIS